jgi:hypothetical protein
MDFQVDVRKNEPFIRRKGAGFSNVRKIYWLCIQGLGIEWLI